MESGGSELSTRGWASGDDFFIVLVIDLVFLVTLSDCDCPVFFSNPLKNIRNRKIDKEHTLLAPPCLVS